MTDDFVSADLSTSLETGASPVVLRVEGEIDLLTAPVLVAALDDALRTGPDVLVDLREVGFIDSTGLRALLEARARAVQDGGGIALRMRDQGPVARLLDLAGVTRLFDLGTGQRDGG